MLGSRESELICKFTTSPPRSVSSSSFEGDTPVYRWYIDMASVLSSRFTVPLHTTVEKPSALMSVIAYGYSPEGPSSSAAWKKNTPTPDAGSPISAAE